MEHLDLEVRDQDLDLRDPLGDLLGTLVLNLPRESTHLE